ncbi:MAG TPA: SBBP repeat-containing protein [Phycisphaerae bacterium]|nr:SBBP repeat-containing protein [Phycisphaerae bacterium]
MRNSISIALVAFALTLCEKAATAGTPYSIDWSRQFGTNFTEFGLDVAVDLSGNVFATGYSSGNLNGQPNSGSGTYDAYLTKHDSSGSLLWTRLIGTSSEDRGHEVRVDAAGNAFVAGRTTGNLAGLAGGEDGFVRKIDPNGTTLWTRQFGTSAADSAEGLSLDSTGNVYVSGYTRGNLDGQFNSGDTDAFLRKFDSNGNFQWTRLFGTNVHDDSVSVSVDPSGNSYFTGITNAGLGSCDMYLAKYDSSGNSQWTNFLGSSSCDVATSVKADASGNIYLTGHTTAAFFDGQPSHGSSDVVLVKYNSAGSRLWTRLLGTSNIDQAYGLAIDDISGAVFVTGETRGSLGGPNQGDYDYFLTKWDPSGVPLWTQQLGTNSADLGMGLTTDPFGRVYATGYSSGSLFGPSAGNSDAILIKYTPEPAAFLMIVGLAMLHRRRR